MVQFRQGVGIRRSKNPNFSPLTSDENPMTLLKRHLYSVPVMVVFHVLFFWGYACTVAMLVLLFLNSFSWEFWACSLQRLAIHSKLDFRNTP